MSDLAFNVNGERFDVPVHALGWRVRRLKPSGRGQPEVVFGDDGGPLFVSIEAGLDEFRRSVGGEPGRYRLDPVDERQASIDGAMPAYLQLGEQRVPEERGHACANDALIRDLTRANADMVRVMTEQFAGVMAAAAQLIRAADGAGLPAREPIPAPEPRNAAPAPVEPEKETTAPFAQVLSTIAEHAMPVVNHAINTKVLGLSQEQSIALLGGTPPPAPSPTETPTPEPDDSEDADEDVQEQAEAPDFGAHLAAIEAELEPHEMAMARRAVMQMSPELLAQWRIKLLSMTPKEAASLIRSEVQKASEPEPTETDQEQTPEPDELTASAKAANDGSDQ